MKLSKKIGLITCVFMQLQLSAQHSPFRLGFQISPGVAWMTTNDLGVTNVGSNLTMGISARGEIGISDRLSATTGAGLTFNRGGTLRHETGGNFFPESRLSNGDYNSGQKPLPDGTKLKYRLQYVEIPVALKWYVYEDKVLRYFAEAPVITWGVTVRRRGAIDAGEIHVDNEDISKDVNPFNIILGFGGGVEYTVGSKTSVVAGLSFHRGLIDVTNNAATRATHNPDNNPFDPNDDYILSPEDARAVLNAFVIRMGILF